MLEEYEERLGYNNPITEEYTEWVKGLFVGPDDHVRHHRRTSARAPCLGMSYRDRTAGRPSS